MPRYYCDYCDTHLTHDSPSVRKQHNAGYKHKANVREYYQQFEQLQTQTLIDQKIKEHLSQGGMYQIGAAFNQHLATVPGFQGPRPPILPPPVFPYPGAAPSQMGPGFRPPVLPRQGVPGYGMPPQMAQIPGQPPPQMAQIPGQPPPQMAQIPGQPPPQMAQIPGQPPPQMAQIPGQAPITSTLPMPPNGLPRPPPMSAPEGIPTPSSSGAPPGITQSMYQPNPNGGPPPASASTDSYAFAPAPGR